MSRVGARQFVYFRLVLGVYLVWRFVSLALYGKELFGVGGMLSDPSSNPTYGYFPNLFALPLPAPLLVALLLSFAVAALLFCFGYHRRVLALLLWYGNACLLHRNNLTENPSLALIGWLLLACAVIPIGENVKDSSADTWQVPPLIIYGAWAILGVGYSLSGLHKYFLSPSWVNGEALRYVLESPLAYPWAQNFWLPRFHAPLALMTEAVLWSEILFGFACLCRFTRGVAWLVMSSIHLGLLLTISFPELTIGLLIFQLFVFDARWLPSREVVKQ